LPAADWPPERLAKAERNYCLEYVRSGLPRLVEFLGPAEAAHIGRSAGRLIGAQAYQETASLLGISGDGPEDFAELMVRLADGEGDEATLMRGGGAAIVRRSGWRLTRGLGPQSPAVFEAWNGLLEGLLSVHNRFLVLDTMERLDWGDPSTTWRIRRAPGGAAAIKSA
jgi:hypothetical protein